ncbi:uncharacterized protein TrAtP1_008236 [Trichoderma atroviride]|uniref:Uncharacterized protein n=1 Tax=Hypocrea atroviridis (strain ATCC 20476 / IMI 206040) TaxID=452589 RepID=G9NZA6_HYPAI|nr:uncharacterized protein TRIATDRAFT_309210 [Trichoderma atroviride IMI 206040]EHK43816.1 hypothetical protein TRIATDRAFT_309210 [Trichoderma atroviride IMI 206040]UKZ67074.1 hypothetical protein TrAtP1_008236 [Trichoderma atroviride]
MTSQQPRNGNSASNRSPSNSTAQDPAMLSRFLYDRTSLSDRLVARSFNAATQNRPNGHEASASELEYYMSQSMNNADATANPSTSANTQAGRATGR